MSTITNLPETLDLTFYRGDTAPALAVTISGVANIASARFVARRGSAIAKTIATPTEMTLAIAGGNTTLTILPWVVNLAPLVHNYDLETTDTDGVVKTYIAGTLTVIRDVAE